MEPQSRGWGGGGGGGRQEFSTQLANNGPGLSVKLVQHPLHGAELAQQHHSAQPYIYPEPVCLNLEQWSAILLILEQPGAASFCGRAFPTIAAHALLGDQRL